jgi:dihydroorotase
MTFDRRAYEARGLLVVRGFIDLHAHLREPGFEESETIATGAHAALRGGFTTVCAMPNTEPAVDSAGLVAQVATRAVSAGGARVLPTATITKGRRGAELSDFVELAAAGAVAFSDDGAPVSDAGLFRHALEYSRTQGLLIVEHAQDLSLSGKGVMHEGSVSAELGLAGLPAAAEEAAVARDLALARLAGARLHLTHLSTAGSVELVRRAKAEGAAVTCDVTPHHLALTDEWVAGSRTFAWEQAARGRAMPYDANTKVNPPLRSRADVRALWAAIADGTVDAIATDHAPHASIHKDVEFDHAAFGISGLETALPLVLGGVDAGWASWDAVLAALTSGPAGVLGIALPKDDWTVVDPDAEWVVDADGLISKGKNTPLLGMKLKGRVVEVAVDGESKFNKSHAAEAIGAR